MKARATLDDAAYAITPISSSASSPPPTAWLATHPQYGTDDLRFDAMLVAPGHLPRHLTARLRRDTIVIAAGLPCRKRHWKVRARSAQIAASRVPVP